MLVCIQLLGGSKLPLPKFSQCSREWSLSHKLGVTVWPAKAEGARDSIAEFPFYPRGEPETCSRVRRDHSRVKMASGRFPWWSSG